MRERLTLSSLALLLLGSPAAAQSPDSTGLDGEASGPRAAAELRLGGSWAANFAQAPLGAPRRDIGSTTGEARIYLPLGDGTASLHAQIGGTVYQEFDPGAAARAGLRWARGPHDLEAGAGVQWRSPRVEVADELGFADILHLGASYRLRPLRMLQLGAHAQLSSETYGASTERDSRLYELGGAVRYRGFGSRFSPEVGAALGARDVRLDTEDHEQRAWWLSLRSAPVPALYLHLRYRNRTRQYATEDDSARNFGREDQRHQLTFAAEAALSTRWSWTAYYALEDARSTIPSRTFRTQLLSTGLAYRLAGW